jgi:tetratricopeptide (TPR) repeat protein
VAPSRIDDLRRRVEADPASIAFAQLAEEYRRAGQAEAAVRVCRDGLPRHPGYLSARVTLGRALLDLGQLDEARLEFQLVAVGAPENLAAVRGLAEIFYREGDATAALEHFQRALALARHDPELEDIVQQLSRQVGAETGPSTGLTFEEADHELLSAADRLPPVTADLAATTTADHTGGATAPFNFDTLVAALGTPTAPPQIEAVMRGETPPVFELPELPDLGADPFAALEAELRGQVGSPGEPAAALEAPSLDEPAADERIEKGGEEPAAAPRHDGVLDELEDSLNSPQDRSSQ